jgi:hypothetical protein
VRVYHDGSDIRQEEVLGRWDSDADIAVGLVERVLTVTDDYVPLQGDRWSVPLIGEIRPTPSLADSDIIGYQIVSVSVRADGWDGLAQVIRIREPPGPESGGTR